MCIAEFVGTLLLISAVAFAKTPVYVIAAFAVATTIGSDLNPAVTLFKWMSGKVSQQNALYLVGAQLVAGACVGILYSMKKT
jgi:glycerol uptake facilitator-like aquaporin|uniref:Major intrinsic protein n=1 Tax=viral metagenome TaxID=1070528 RepID=A0A6C0HF87_9ZZZZ